jgi:hypothetical protein
VNIIDLFREVPGFRPQGKAWEKTKRKRMIAKMNIHVKRNVKKQGARSREQGGGRKNKGQRA